MSQYTFTDVSTKAQTKDGLNANFTEAYGMRQSPLGVYALGTPGDTVPTGKFLTDNGNTSSTSVIVLSQSILGNDAVFSFLQIGCAIIFVDAAGGVASFVVTAVAGDGSSNPELSVTPLFNASQPWLVGGKYSLSFMPVNPTGFTGTSAGGTFVNGICTAGP